MDEPLSEILRGLRVRSFTCPEGSSCVPKALESASQSAALTGWFYVALEGRWTIRREAADPVPLLPGDAAICRYDTPHALHADAKQNPSLIRGGFAVDLPHPRHPLARMEPVIRLDHAQEELSDWLPALATALHREITGKALARQLIIDHVVQILIALALRQQLSRNAPSNDVAALLDPDIGPALASMHLKPEHPWTVASLAASVAMSRSAFAAKFTRCVGGSPLNYLGRYRLQRAHDRLVESNARIKEVAAEIGYSSEAAFSSAFKRQYGAAPGVFRRRAKK